jgi:hypothetical protein
MPSSLPLPMSKCRAGNRFAFWAVPSQFDRKLPRLMLGNGKITGLRGMPYAIDLCREIVEDVSTELDGMEVKVGFAPVTPANRLQKTASGDIDLECGSTTANMERRKEVAFSPIFFIAGTKLMVPKSSSIRSYRDLDGRAIRFLQHRAAVCSGGVCWRHCGQESSCLFKPWCLRAKVAFVVSPVLLIVTT